MSYFVEDCTKFTKKYAFGIFTNFSNLESNLQETVQNVQTHKTMSTQIRRIPLLFFRKLLENCENIVCFWKNLESRQILRPICICKHFFLLSFVSLEQQEIYKLERQAILIQFSDFFARWLIWRKQFCYKNWFWIGK